MAFSSDYISQIFSYQIRNNHRTIFILIGEGSKAQIPVLHERLSRQSSLNNIVWCFKNADTYLDKECKKIKISEEDDEYSKWVKTVNPDFLSYRENNRILGRTCDMLIIQDFEAMTPNMLACSLETVRGGGAIVLLFDREKSINDIINKSSDLVDESLGQLKFVPRFNRRLFKSLTQTNVAVFLDSKLRVMDITKEKKNLEEKLRKQSSTNNDKALKEEISNLCTSLLSSTNINKTESILDMKSSLLNICKTKDQLNALFTLIEAIDTQSSNIHSLVAARGRGKSASLGLSIAYAILSGFSSIYISALFIENVQSIFAFIIQGLNSLGYKKMVDYKIIYLFEGKKRLISKIEIVKGAKSAIEYVHPQSEYRVQPSLLVIDEAASIPLPILKKLLRNGLIFLASTANGYEGTGRVFRTKLTEFIKEKGFVQRDITMEDPIRYASKDKVEEWLNTSLLLEPQIQKIDHISPPNECMLYHVNKDALFSGLSKTEEFLEEVFSLFISSHYRNSPNDLQILSDSPNHEVFVLVTPSKPSKVVCAIQVAFEGKCTKTAFSKEGNLIPWVVYDNFFNAEFLSNFGVRIVRIAVHPSLLSMGYGSLALSKLTEILGASTSEVASIQLIDKNTVLNGLEKITTPKIEWIGSSFGVTEKLLNFWKRAGFAPICLKQTPSKTTGEFSLLVLKECEQNNLIDILKMKKLFLQRTLSLLPSSFKTISPTLVLSLIYSSDISVSDKPIAFSTDEKDRLFRFAKGTIDLRSIQDILFDFSRYFFFKKDINRISVVAQTLLILLGLQQISFEDAVKILDIEPYKLINLLSSSIEIIVTNYSKDFE